MARLQYDNLYFFRYKNPTSRLKKWDTAPLAIPLDITGKSLLAVNLHWIPKNEQADFVEFILKFFVGTKRIGRKRVKLRLFYGVLKAKAPKYLIAIRRYHISGMTGVVEIPKEQWPRILKKRQYKAKVKHTTSVASRLKSYFGRR